MGLSYELTDGLLQFQTVGDVEFLEGLAILRAGLGRAAMDPIPGGWPILFDIRFSQESRTADDLRVIARIVGEYRLSLSGYCAIVVSTPLYHGLGRMAAVFLESAGLETMIFNEIEAAAEWLREPTGVGA